MSVLTEARLAKKSGTSRVAVRLSIRLSVLGLLVLGLPCGGAVI